MMQDTLLQKASQYNFEVVFVEKLERIPLLIPRLGNERRDAPSFSIHRVIKQSTLNIQCSVVGS